MKLLKWWCIFDFGNNPECILGFDVHYLILPVSLTDIFVCIYLVAHSISGVLRFGNYLTALAPLSALSSLRLLLNVIRLVLQILVQPKITVLFSIIILLGWIVGPLESESMTGIWEHMFVLFLANHI